MPTTCYVMCCMVLLAMHEGVGLLNDSRDGVNWNEHMNRIRNARLPQNDSIDYREQDFDTPQGAGDESTK